MNIVKDTTEERLREMVDNIVKNIEEGLVYQDDDWGREGEMMSGLDYLDGYYSVEYYVAADRETVTGARFMVAGGGPNIFIDTKFKTVEGYWWSDKYIARYYDDPMDLDSAPIDLWGC